MMDKKEARETLSGYVRFHPYAEGTKSESTRPYLELLSGGERSLYKQGDNPFINESLVPFNDKRCEVVGVTDESGCLVVLEIEEIMAANDDPVL